MFKKPLVVVLFFFTVIAVKAENGQKVDSKIQKVTVFLNSAQIIRSATVNVTAGTSTLVFTNLSPGINVQSIQVHADGEFTILSVKHELNFLNEQAKEKSLEDLQAQQKIIADKIAVQNTLFSINEEEENMLKKNQVISGANVNLDVARLQQALDFQTLRLTEIKRKQRAINDELVALNNELQKYNHQISELNKSNSKVTSNILVTVSSKTIVQSIFTLSYVVNNAGWFPTYDIRAKNVNSPISISYKANVSQQTGEDWNNVKLTLSTGNPTVSGSKPELEPYYLSFGMYTTPPAGAITRITGRITDRSGAPLVGTTIKIKGSSIATIADVNGNYSIQVPGGSPTLIYSFVGYETAERLANTPVINIALNEMANELNEVAVVSALQGKVAGVMVDKKEIRIKGFTNIPVAVQAVENQTNIEFHIDNPYTVPADAKQYVVEINQVDLPATYQYTVAPKLSTDVFLTARFTDWNKYNFLSGEANLFFEGTYIGKSLIDTHTAADTLSLSLGTDKNIVVTRTLDNKVSTRQFLSSNVKETRNWLIDIKNRKGQPVNLLVEDQVPVSQNSDIEVETQEISGGLLNKENGKLAWIFTMNPTDEKKIQLKYQVRYPKNQSVIVQ